MNVIRGGTIVYWAAPRWRRALYRLGVKRHHARLGDVKRAEQLEAETRLLRSLEPGPDGWLQFKDGRPYLYGRNFGRDWHRRPNNPHAST